MNGLNTMFELQYVLPYIIMKHACVMFVKWLLNNTSNETKTAAMQIYHFNQPEKTEEGLKM